MAVRAAASTLSRAHEKASRANVSDAENVYPPKLRANPATASTRTVAGGTDGGGGKNGGGAGAPNCRTLHVGIEVVLLG